MTYLDLSEMPEDPIPRLLWLSGLDQAVSKEINLAWQGAYFEARMQGCFREALNLGLHSHRRALAWTRHENEARNRILHRWQDGF
jgi:hypothetical protein